MLWNLHGSDITATLVWGVPAGFIEDPAPFWNISAKFHYGTATGFARATHLSGRPSRYDGVTRFN